MSVNWLRVRQWGIDDDVWCFKFTEEKLGRTERTEYEAEFQQLEKKTDLTKSYTEKIKNNTAAVIIPNPSKGSSHQTIIHRLNFSEKSVWAWKFGVARLWAGIICPNLKVLLAGPWPGQARPGSSSD